MKVFLVSLGCDKNRVDSEEMLGLLSAAGFSFTDDENEADIIIVNTCCFIDSAKEESIEAILEMAEYKKSGRCKRLIVAGCMAERYKQEVLTEFPEVDDVVGVNELSDIIHASDPSNASEVVPEDIQRIITTAGHYEFLKIAEGCNKRCTYCIIPYLRGRYRSYSMDKLLSEAKMLADSGVKELILVAQETSIYGTDLYGENKLPELLRELCKIDGFEWIRVLYTYPEDITEEYLKTMASEEKIVNYIDMPIQHASDNILKKMGRRTSHEDLVNIIAKAREIVADVAIRTTLITGFPGETEEDHEILMNFVDEIEFDRLGVFTYSQEEGTPASKFDCQIDEDVKESRLDELMTLQSEISYEKMSTHAGKRFKVIIDGYLPDDNVYIGRTYMDAPDVDGFFYVNSDISLMTGDFCIAEVSAFSEYDLYGDLVEKL